MMTEAEIEKLAGELLHVYANSDIGMEDVAVHVAKMLIEKEKDTTNKICRLFNEASGGKMEMIYENDTVMLFSNGIKP